jgi:hypothetical protein
MKSSRNDTSDAIIRRFEKEFGFPREAIRREVLISSGPKRYRPDYVIYDEGRPGTIIETKKYQNQLEIENQLGAMMKASGANYGVIADIHGDIMGSYRIVDLDLPISKIPSIPPYGRKLEEMGAHLRKDLAVTPDLTEVLKHAFREIFKRHRSCI